MMKKNHNWWSHTCFDVAVGPTYLAIFGLPAAALLITLVLVILAIRLMIRAYRKRNREKDQENKP